MTALRAGSTASSQKWEATRSGALADHPGPWNEFLETVSTQSGLDLLATVNLWVNWRVSYRDDLRGDEWANAGMTLERGFGDCEDFALTKLALLSASGRRSDEMYLVLLRDRVGLDHAVLAVREAGRLYVLDNRTDKIQPAEAIDDYRPVLSFSGPFAWTYGQTLK